MTTVFVTRGIYALTGHVKNHGYPEGSRENVWAIRADGVKGILGMRGLGPLLDYIADPAPWVKGADCEIKKFKKKSVLRYDHDTEAICVEENEGVWDSCQYNYAQKQPNSRPTSVYHEDEDIDFTDPSGIDENAINIY